MMSIRLTMTMVIAVKLASCGPQPLQDESLRNSEVQRRFALPYSYQAHYSSGLNSHQTGADRFRFLHMGLGKRGLKPLSTMQDTQGSESDHNRARSTIQNLLNDAELYNDLPFTKYYLLGTRPEPYLYRTKWFRALKSSTDPNGKRTPEEFSETLYPIQAGKQQLEVTLDKTLNDADDGYEYSDVAAADTNEEIVTDNDGFPAESSFESQTKTPYDLIFASPDLQIVYPQERVESEATRIHRRSGSMTHESLGRGKRWWAARMLSQFRSPKSWTRQSFDTQTRIDPALYFIGLG